MVTIDLKSALFREKVYGCWLGKNCGGTLGGPLEKRWGEAEPYDVWWYPELQEGGIPNDDLEMQLVWLKALEEVGPRLQAADLAGYWLDYIGYNFDEYGLSKTNLRLGLLPPISGAYNNWFKDCMGSPIRSEIWACVAPGVPSVAVRLAYEDAICDHAGGEGVFGELFNAAIESAAFVIDDRELLLEIGLSYIPAWSKTAKAIAAARTAYGAGEDWKAARALVLQTTPHPVAQYSPINLGFQVIGWLYGENFGDALCKAVNCGYDTDCTGATLGSILGILAGRRRLPQKWTEPLGETISTNEAWGGLRHVSKGPNPIPTNLAELTDRTCVMAKRVLTAYSKVQGDGLVQVDPETLKAGDEIRSLWEASSMQLEYRCGTISVGVDYRDAPTCVPSEEKTVMVTLTNPHLDPVQAHCGLRLPDGWTTTAEPREIALPPKSTTSVTWNIKSPQASRVDNSNTLFLLVQPQGYPAQPATPIVLIGAHKYRYQGPFVREGLSDRELFDHAFEPEAIMGSLLAPEGRAGPWNDCYALDNTLPLGDIFARDGALYVQTYLWAPTAQQVWMGADTTCPVKFWVNGELIAKSYAYRPVRPNYDGEAESGFAVAQLVEGWNEVLLKFVRAADAPAFEGYFLMSSADRLHNGLPEIRWTRAPWDERDAGIAR